LIRSGYFTYKYDMYLKEKYPEKAGDFGYMARWGSMHNSLRDWIEIFLKTKVGEVELVRFKTRARNSTIYALLCFLAPALEILVIFVIGKIIPS